MTELNKYLELHTDEFKRWLVDNEQGRVDIKILPYLKDIENGFFVEAGALDGLFQSNTKILEDLGWNGILVEPAPKAYLKCKQNRKCIVENCALVSKDYNLPVAYGDFFFDGENGYGAWSGILRSHYGIKATMEVPAKTLDSVLKSHGIKKIDFLSLDVEGYETEVLGGINFIDTEITYMLIEVNTEQYSLSDINLYLGQFGYVNLGCLSGFTDTLKGWDGSHNDYLYKK